MLWFKFARRYMFSPKSHSVINIIVAVSLVAVAVPTAALVVLLAVFNGLNATIEELYSAVDADIEILAERGQTFEADAIDLDALRKTEGVDAVAPYIEQSVMLSFGDRHTAVTLRGIDSLYCDALPIASLIGRGSIEADLKHRSLLEVNEDVEDECNAKISLYNRSYRF